MIYKLIWLALFIYGVTDMILNGYPDALACSTGFIRGRTATTLYVWHAGLYYCQVYGEEGRCVIFNFNGTYQRGVGDFGSRSGCEGKSLNQLRA